MVIAWIRSPSKMLDWFKAKLRDFFLLPAKTQALRERATEIRSIIAVRDPAAASKLAQVQADLVRIEGSHVAMASRVNSLLVGLGKLGVKLPGLAGCPVMGEAPLTYVPGLGVRRPVMPWMIQREPVRVRVQPPRILHRFPVELRQRRLAVRRLTRGRRGGFYGPAVLPVRIPQPGELGILPVIPVALIITGGAVALGVGALFADYQRQKSLVDQIEKGVLTAEEAAQLTAAGKMFGFDFSLKPLVLVAGIAAAVFVLPKLMTKAA